MTIRKFEYKDIASLISFNIKSYKQRNDIEEYFYYRFIKNPFIKNSGNEILIAEDENKNIRGQILMMPSRFSFGGKIYLSFWAMDFIVDESNRGLTGVVLAKKAIKVENHFSIGLTKVALNLHLALGEKIAGYMIKFIKLNNIFSLFRFLFIINQEKSMNHAVPESLNVNSGCFKRVYSPEEIVSAEGYWNLNLIEFTRCIDFLKWRFFHYPDKYFVYRYFPKNKENELNPSYFVVRPIIWKRVNCLLLVDYRFSITEIDMFDNILTAASFLSKQLKMAATITGCSFPRGYRILRRKWFFRFSENMEVVTTFHNDLDYTDTKKDLIFVTYADSDGDFYYGNNKW